MIPDRFDILPEAQRRLVPVLGPFARRFGYYLAGGTAIALYFGHRESIDFDFFALPSALAGQPLLDQLLASGIAFELTSVSPGTLLGIVEGVKVSFFHYPYPHIAPVHPFSNPGLDVASIPDLCAMKLSAAAQRGARKDFIDIHRLMLGGAPIASMLEYYRQKYAQVNIAHVLRGLTYYDDAEPHAMPKLYIPMDWGQIKRDISSAVRDLSRRGTA
jgi:hypothetical protein